MTKLWFICFTGCHCIQLTAHPPAGQTCPEHGSLPIDHAEQLQPAAGYSPGLYACTNPLCHPHSCAHQDPLPITEENR